MIYDHTVKIYDVSGADVLGRRLTGGECYYCAVRTVGLNRFYTALQLGDRTDAQLELPGHLRILSTQIAVFGCEQFRILQAQHETDKDGLPVTVLSLMRLEESYELDCAD